MSQNAGSMPLKQRNDERLFVIVAVVGSLVFGAGFCFLLYALNNRENDAPNQTGSIPTSASSPFVGICEENERKKAEFQWKFQ